MPTAADVAALEASSPDSFSKVGTQAGAIPRADDQGTLNVWVTQTMTFMIPLAAAANQNIFTAARAMRVTNIAYANSVQEAKTGTVVKATGTSAPASGTTPMHSAGGYNFNTAAHTVTTLTLTSTAADLVLAAGDRIGLVLSGALTTGCSCLTIEYRYI